MHRRSGIAVIALFFGFFLGLTSAMAEQIYFAIRSAKDKNVQFEVTDAVIARVGMMSYRAVLPSSDGQTREVRGPLIRDLLKAAGVDGQEVQVDALDKYSIYIPTSDFTTYDVIAAIAIDGKPMSIRERGPAWLVYPTVDHPEMQNNSVYETRSVWQLKELTVK